MFRFCWGCYFCCSHPQPGSHTPTRLKHSTLCVLQESESAEEESSPGSERGSIDRGPAPQAIAEGNDQMPGILLAVASSSSSSSLTKGSFKSFGIKSTPFRARHVYLAVDLLFYIYFLKILVAIIAIHIYRHFQTVMVTEEKLLPSRPLGSQAGFFFFFLALFDCKRCMLVIV